MLFPLHSFFPRNSHFLHAFLPSNWTIQHSFDKSDCRIVCAFTNLITTPSAGWRRSGCAGIPNKSRLPSKLSVRGVSHVSVCRLQSSSCRSGACAGLTRAGTHRAWTYTCILCTVTAARSCRTSDPGTLSGWCLSRHIAGRITFFSWLSFLFPPWFLFGFLTITHYNLFQDLFFCQPFPCSPIFTFMIIWFWLIFNTFVDFRSSSDCASRPV